MKYNKIVDSSVSENFCKMMSKKRFYVCVSLRVPGCLSCPVWFTVKLMVKFMSYNERSVLVCLYLIE